jgi:hypothetical protein
MSTPLVHQSRHQDATTHIRPLLDSLQSRSTPQQLLPQAQQLHSQHRQMLQSVLNP